MDFDEINIPKRAIPYEKYFKEMGLSEEETEERIETANKLEEMMLFFFALVSMYEGALLENYDYLVTQLETRYNAEISRITAVDEYLDNYVKDYAKNVTRATVEGIENPWYLSKDRAMFDAENEAVFVIGYKDYVKAKKQGKKRKKWVAFIDKHTRKTHAEVNGKTIPIDGVFRVGGGFFRFPKDTYYGEFPEETVNCRCHVVYK